VDGGRWTVDGFRGRILADLEVRRVARKDVAREKEAVSKLSLPQISQIVFPNKQNKNLRNMRNMRNMRETQ